MKTRTYKIRKKQKLLVKAVKLGTLTIKGACKILGDYIENLRL